LVHLIRLRASQINGCAYCLDMHWKGLRAINETEQRLYSLDAWCECPYHTTHYTDRERAALAWTEAVTLVADGHVPDAVYREVRPPAEIRCAGGKIPAAGVLSEKESAGARQNSQSAGPFVCLVR
jgi:AhpD family alkylhydroperoxidase